MTAHSPSERTATRFQRQACPTARLDKHDHGHVLQLEATGPFNKGLVIYLFLMGRDLLVETIEQGIPYGVTITFHGSLMMTPDAIQQLDALLQDTERRGGPPPLATAYVVGHDVSGKALMLPILADVYRKTRAFEAFSSADDAAAWMRAALQAAR